MIRENHDAAYAAHPGVKRTCELLALNFWWPGMRKSVEDYVRVRLVSTAKGKLQTHAPLGDLGSPVAPFEITSMEITGPYPLTPRKNRSPLTFVNHISKYAEIFHIQDQSALTCARVYTSQIITRYGSGSKLITDQGYAFMPSFFNETCRIFWIQRSRTSITPRVTAM